jgi:hypothetical protein
MAVLYTPHFMQFFDNNGDPLSGGKLYTYAAGTTTPKASYTTAAGTIENANPVVLDAYGRAVIFIEGAYRFDLFTSADVLVKSTDNVTSFNASTETEEGFFQSFSGDGATTAFTLSENLGTDEKALFVFAIKEFTTNGTFASDTGWTKGAGWTIAAGVATATGAISTALEQTAGNTLIEGREYSIKYTITRSAGSITLSLGGTAGAARSSSGTYSESIIAGSTQVISFGTSGFTGTLDNVTITETAGQSILNPADFTLNGTSLTFTRPPATGTGNIFVFAPYTLIGAAGAAQTAADAAIAAQDAAEGAVNAVAYQFAFDSSTVMADPGTGDFRLNNATLASVTAIAVDALSSVSGNPDVSDAIAAWGASTNTIKGQINIRKSGTPATFAVYNVTAAVTDNTGWLQITVAHVASSGTFSAADVCYLQFTRSGDVGATGAQGPTGTISGASAGTMVGDDKILFLKTSSGDALTYDDPATIDVSIFGSGAAADGYVLTADGAGGTAFEAVSGSGWVPLQTQTVSSPVASVDFTSNISSTYKVYAIVFDSVQPANDGAKLYVRLGNGGSFDSGASDYSWAELYVAEATSPTAIPDGDQADAQIALNNTGNTGNLAVEGIDGGVLYIYNPANTAKYTRIQGFLSGADTGGAGYKIEFSGRRLEAAAHDRIQFLFSSGDVSSGTFTLYGLAGA